MAHGGLAGSGTHDALHKSAAPWVKLALNGGLHFCILKRVDALLVL